MRLTRTRVDADAADVTAVDLDRPVAGLIHVIQAGEPSIRVRWHARMRKPVAEITPDLAIVRTLK